MALPSMTFINRFPQATSTPKIYPMTSFLLHMMEKAMSPTKNVLYPASSSAFFGIAVHWSAKTQPAFVAHSTDSQVRTFYLAKEKVQWLRPILQNLGFQVSNYQNTIYDYSQPTIDIIRVNHITSRFKNISVPINDVH